MNPIKRAKEAVGGGVELSRRLGVTVRTIDNWQAYGVPPKRAGKIEKEAGVPAEASCPEYRFFRDAKGNVTRWERIETGIASA